MALARAVHLDHVAQSARSQIFDDLPQEQLHLVAAEGGAAEPKASRKEVWELIDHLEKLPIGAFQRIWDQPIARATLLLLSGVGTTYLEYLLTP